MEGNYEKWNFSCGERVWLGQFRNLTNVLHWHFEPEIIRVAEGEARICIGDFEMMAKSGDCFFCQSQQQHRIVCCPQGRVEILVFDKRVVEDLTRLYSLTQPYLLDGDSVYVCIQNLRRIRAKKGRLYRESMENQVRGLLIEIYSTNPTKKSEERADFCTDLIRALNDQLEYITYADAVQLSGYSPSHFSKLFQKYFGISFTQYLNNLRVEKAIFLLQRKPWVTVLNISRQCGFSTVRSFNRVFKQITGYSPRELPVDFTMSFCFTHPGDKPFSPTQPGSEYIPE